MAIRTILYDLGKTLVFFDFAPVYRTLVSHSGRPEGEVREVIHERYGEFCCGRMTGRQWHGYLTGSLGISTPYDEFATLWADIFWPNEPMIELARTLRPRYRQYLLSNTDEIHLPWCMKKFPLEPLLDGLILSYEIGAIKPDRAIYERGLERFGLLAGECVFIDDMPANLEGARACGIRTVICDSAAQVRRDLASLGVTV